MQTKDGSYTLYIIYSNKQNQNDMKKEIIFDEQNTSNNDLSRLFKEVSL
ncbi:hypothetical protein HMPREF9969_1009 [Prevotella sp. oral taxon 306 str. F0472]|nr:hypothetical protein HMPREF9969_1009 [Prevotella sp. oral taxon 306 str. F0472]